MANVFLDTWSFLGVEFFGLDEMHLISNVAKQLYNLLTKSNNSKFCPPSCLPKDYPFAFDNSDFTVIQKVWMNQDAIFHLLSAVVSKASMKSQQMAIDLSIG